MLQVKSYSSVLTGFHEYEVIYKEGSFRIVYTKNKQKQNKTENPLNALALFIHLSWQWLAMTASLCVLLMAMCEFPNTMIASRHLDKVNWWEKRK